MPNNALYKTEGTSHLAVVTEKKLCFFCGGKFHSRNLCPANGVLCNNCGKKGHFAKVCQQGKLKKTPNIAAATSFEPFLAAISAPTPECLKPATSPAIINGHEVTALLDTGSSLSFIRYDVATRLNLKIKPSSVHVQMASSNLITDVKGSCVIKLEILERKYDEINLLLIENLCSDVILGQDFFKLHKSITFNFDGAKDNTHILHLLEVCSSAASVEPPSLFSNLTANCKPID